MCIRDRVLKDVRKQVHKIKDDEHQYIRQLYQEGKKPAQIARITNHSIPVIMLHLEGLVAVSYTHLDVYKRQVLRDMLVSPEVTKAIVFTRTKIGADRLTKKLIEDGIKVLTIHGDKTQGQRQNALQRFRTNQVDVLVATDVAARGIDISDISHVFNYDLPEEDESYIHRIGRAGRAGKEGISISLCCHEELGLLASIEKMLKKEIPLIKTEYSIELKRKKASSGKSNRRPPFKKKSDSRSGSDKSCLLYTSRCV